jgi:hypothetical protein
VKAASKVYAGDPVSGEVAYFLRTDKGLTPPKELVTDWERYKDLSIAHRLLAITVAMWREERRHMSPVEQLGVADELQADGFNSRLLFS